MNGLYPIIRRKRRPLVEIHPPVVATTTAPVVAAPVLASEPPAADSKTKGAKRDKVAIGAA